MKMRHKTSRWSVFHLSGCRLQPAGTMRIF